MLKPVMVHGYEFFRTIFLMIFWFIFICLFLVQMLIFSKMWEDMQNGIGTPKIAIIIYISFAIAFFAGLFIRKKIFTYISATGIIILFFYLPSLSELKPYYDYLEMLD